MSSEHYSFLIYIHKAKVVLNLLANIKHTYFENFYFPGFILKCFYFYNELKTENWFIQPLIKKICKYKLVSYYLHFLHF